MRSVHSKGLIVRTLSIGLQASFRMIQFATLCVDIVASIFRRSKP